MDVIEAPAPGELRALALRHGLTPARARPPLPAYLAQLWDRRHFAASLAGARLTAQYSRARLGQVWHVVTPLLHAAVFYLVFGVLLQSRHGVPDYIPFLVTGVFAWSFVQGCAMSGVKAVPGNIGLIRALHFPRAALPLALALQQLRQFLYSALVLVVVLLGFGVPPGPRWLLAVPALVLMTLFGAGLALLLARLGSGTPDLAQAMPFVLRTWMYTSGVMYSLADKAHHLPGPLGAALPYNPAAIYLDLLRYALIDSFGADRLPPHAWPLAAAWAALALTGGLVLFWRAEETYGRD